MKEEDAFSPQSLPGRCGRESENKSVVALQAETQMRNLETKVQHLEELGAGWTEAAASY